MTSVRAPAGQREKTDQPSTATGFNLPATVTGIHDPKSIRRLDPKKPRRGRKPALLATEPGRANSVVQWSTTRTKDSPETRVQRAATREAMLPICLPPSMPICMPDGRPTSAASLVVPALPPCPRTLQLPDLSREGATSPPGRTTTETVLRLGQAIDVRSRPGSP